MDEKKIARAEHKYARISPRKVEIICNMIRGKDANRLRADDQGAQERHGKRREQF